MRGDEMNEYPKFVKKKLLGLIDAMAKDPSSFVQDPKKHFTRNRKLGFAAMIRFILSVGSGSLGNEIGSFFSYGDGFPSVSAFVQQRGKILPEAFRHLMLAFDASVDVDPQLFYGYRLLAVDGSDLTLPLNPAEENAFPKSCCSLLHLNAMYDLCNRKYLDAVIQSGYAENECAAAVEMVDRLSDRFPVILTADRAYENYNLFAHVEERLFDYVIRVKDRDSTGILSGIRLPDTDEFDVTVDITLTRWSTGPASVNPRGYKYLSKGARFDYIKDSKSPDYPISIRFLRFRLEDGRYEVLATSLPQDSFSKEFLQEIYRMRWGIETSFRQLKHVLGLAAFHSKKAVFVIQEVYARLIMYNFSMYLSNQVQLPEKEHRNELQLNFTQAIKICLYFFRCMDDESPPDVEASILRFLLPIRHGRNLPRKAARRGVVGFNYRLA